MTKIKNLVFDLDGTLYPYSAAVEQNVNNKVLDFFRRRLFLSAEQAQSVIERLRSRNNYEAEVMEDEFGVSKQEFVEEVCDVDVSMLQPDPELVSLLASLPQRKFIFTDSTDKHVRDVLKQINVPVNLFEEIVDAHRTAYLFKYRPQAFRAFLALTGITPEETLIFEDNPCNIVVAKQENLGTVLISPEMESCAAADYTFPDICSALRELF